MSTDDPSTLPAADVPRALAVAGAALLLYLATLQPGFGGPEDTPKFQFLGHVLGTAHPPGYPLYVLLSHLFVKIPVGTIAYRANLFSAVLAACGAALAYVIGRRIGAGWIPAAGGALGMAAGASYWRSAVFAEVYSLAAVMAGATIALLLGWAAAGRISRLFGAVAAFALGLGNHLTIAGVAPACALFAVLRDRRVLRPRVLVIAVALLCAGALQYGFIILRSRQAAPFLESYATTIPELLSVIRAERFAEQRFAFTPWFLLTVHAPVVLETIAIELGVAGVCLFVVGCVTASRRRLSSAALVAGGGAGMLAMVFNLSGDIKGFVTPVMVFAWPLVAVGIEGLGAALSGRVSSRSVAAVVLLVSVSLPAANVARNYRGADHSGQTGDAEFLRALHAQLPSPAAVVVEDYYYDMALQYMALTGEAPPGKVVERVPFDAPRVRETFRADPARPIYAFAGGATFLATAGLRFLPVTVAGASLDDWLRQLPRGTLLVGAAALLPGPVDLVPIGHPRARPPGRPQAFELFAAVAGRDGAAWRKDDRATSLFVDAATLGAPTLPSVNGELRAVAESGSARIELGGRTLAKTSQGLAIAAFTPDGILLRALELAGWSPWHVPSQRALYELHGESPCITLGGEWTDATPAMATGSWVATLPALGSTSIEVEVTDGRPVRPSAAVLAVDGSARIPENGAGAEGAMRWVTELARTGGRRPVFRVAVDRAGVRAKARLVPGGSARALAICAHQPHPLFTASRNAGELRTDFESEAYFGAGWSGAERSPSGAVRRAADRATLLLPLDRAFDHVMTLEIAPARGGRFDVLEDGASFASCDVARPRCEVRLPARPSAGPVTALTLAGDWTGGSGSSREPLVLRGARLERSAR